MLLASGAKKIHVCAPSNAAVDEVLCRLSSDGLLGHVSGKDMKAKLLRIGAMEYEPTSVVKQHTLDARLFDTLKDAKIYNLKEQVAFCDELITELDKGFKLEWQNNRHRVAL